MPTVNVPGVGRVNFPDNMSQEDIVRAIEQDILPTTRRAPFSLKDTAIAATQGVVGAGKSITDVFGADNPVSQMLGGMQQSLQSKISPARQAEMERRRQTEEEAAKSGSTMQEISAFLGGVAEAPVQSLAQALGSFVPYMGTSILGAVAKLGGPTLRAVNAAVGTAQGAGAVKGSIYDEVKDNLVKQGMSEEEAKRHAAQAQATLGENFLNIAVGAGLGGVAATSGIENLLTRQGAQAAAQKALPRIGTAAATEALTEGPQGAQERYATNVALQRAGVDTPVMQGVVGSGVRDALLGAVAAGPVAAVRGPETPPPAQPPAPAATVPAPAAMPTVQGALALDTPEQPTVAPATAFAPSGKEYESQTAATQQAEADEAAATERNNQIRDLRDAYDLFAREHERLKAEYEATEDPQRKVDLLNKGKEVYAQMVRLEEAITALNPERRPGSPEARAEAEQAGQGAFDFEPTPEPVAQAGATPTKEDLNRMGVVSPKLRATLAKLDLSTPEGYTGFVEAINNTKAKLNWPEVERFFAAQPRPQEVVGDLTVAAPQPKQPGKKADAGDKSRGEGDGPRAGGEGTGVPVSESTTGGGTAATGPGGLDVPAGDAAVPVTGEEQRQPALKKVEPKRKVKKVKKVKPEAEFDDVDEVRVAASPYEQARQLTSLARYVATLQKPVDEATYNKSLDAVVDIAEGIYSTGSSSPAKRAAKRALAKYEATPRGKAELAQARKRLKDTNELAKRNQARSKRIERKAAANDITILEQDLKKELQRVAKNPAEAAKIAKTVTKLEAKIKRLEAKMKDLDEDVAFSAGETTAPTGNTVDKVVKAVERVMRPDSGLDRITTVVQSVRQLPEAVRQSKDYTPGVRGVAHRGQIWLVADNIPQGRELGIFLHEAGAHIGFDKVLNAKDRQFLADQVRKWAAGTDTKGEAAKVALVKGKDSNDEIIAYTVEELVNRGVKPTSLRPESTWLKRVLDAFKAALKKIGFMQDITPQELVDAAFGAAHIAVKTPVEENLNKEARFGRFTPRELRDLEQELYEDSQFDAQTVIGQKLRDAAELVKRGRAATVPFEKRDSLGALAPEYRRVWLSAQAGKELQPGDQLILDELETIYNNYARAMNRLRPGSALSADKFIEHILYYAEAVKFPDNTYIFGNTVLGMFVPTHFAPATLRGGAESIYSLGQSNTMFVVTDDLATQLEKAGYYKVKNYSAEKNFRGEPVTKRIVLAPQSELMQRLSPQGIEYTVPKVAKLLDQIEQQHGYLPATVEQLAHMGVDLPPTEKKLLSLVAPSTSKDIRFSTGDAALDARAAYRTEKLLGAAPRPLYKQIGDFFTSEKTRKKFADFFNVNVVDVQASVKRKLLDEKNVAPLLNLSLASRSMETAVSSMLHGAITLRSLEGSRAKVFGVSEGPSLADVHAKVQEIAKKIGGGTVTKESFTTASRVFDLGSIVLRLRSLPADQKALFKFPAEDIAAGETALRLYGDEITAAMETWTKYKNGLLQAGKTAGRFTAEDVEMWSNAADFVPWYRKLDDSTDGYEVKTSAKQFFSGLQTPGGIKELMGGDVEERPIGDILNNMEQLSFWLVNSAIRNYAATQTVDALPGAKKVGSPTASGVDNTRVVKVFRNGEPVFYELADSLDAYAFMPTQEITTPLLRVASKVSNVLRKGTTLMPGFVVSQVFQDAFRVTAYSGVKSPFKVGAQTFSEFFNAFKEDDITKTFASFGLIGQPDFVFEGEKSRLRAALDETKTGYQRTASAAMKALDKMTRASDAAQRRALYKQVMDETGDEALALYKASEIINFQLRGRSQSIAMLRQVVPFVNAYIQGMSVALRSMAGRGVGINEKRAALTAFYGTAAKIFALSALYAWLVGDDDEYKDAADHERLSNFIIPGTREMIKEFTGSDPGGNIRIPVPMDPVGFMFKALPEVVMNVLTREGTKDEMDATKVRRMLSDAAINALSPPNAIPQVVKPTLEVVVNKSFFTGRPIVGMGLEDREKAQQFTSSTSTLARVMGQFMPLAPVQIDHLMRGYLGIGGGTMMWAASNVMDATMDAPRPSTRLNEIPQIRTFLTGRDTAGMKEDYYELRDKASKVNGTVNLFKTRDPKQLQEYIQKNRDLLRIQQSGIFGQIDKQFSEIRKYRDHVDNSDMSREQKREISDRLDKMELYLLSQINLPGLRRLAGL